MGFDRIHYLFMLKDLENLDIWGLYCNIIKASFNKPTDSIILIENFDAFVLKPGTRNHVHPPSFNILSEVLARKIKQEEIKHIQIGKEDGKVFLFIYDMIIYIYNLTPPPETPTVNKHFQQDGRT